MQPNVYFNAILLADGQNVSYGSDSVENVYNYYSGEDATLLRFQKDEDEGSLAQRCPHKTNSKFLLSVLHQIPVMDACPLVDLPSDDETALHVGSELVVSRAELKSNPVGNVALKCLVGEKVVATVGGSSSLRRKETTRRQALAATEQRVRDAQAELSAAEQTVMDLGGQVPISDSSELNPSDSVSQFGQRDDPYPLASGVAPDAWIDLYFAGREKPHVRGNGDKSSVTIQLEDSLNGETPPQPSTTTTPPPPPPPPPIPRT
ncbi:hypothetical protein DAPPUDRAFT_109357 [Daphnia pulex]|uniref:Uncharacterized protein n=1 Tax=Daphnia pulex TaxID=6669 RepID=E9H2S7_DAPPU|nr:hypothetical protein DAPPUDRAFT_109357 [Daphnia pulex]|eukprot:EFX73957.1 hypothetical protein DAPPUDRAFT_109357 [Daphnia pulex]